MLYYKPFTPLPVEMLYPFGTAQDGEDIIVVHGGLDSPGGIFGRFKTQEEARQFASSLNARYRELSQASNAASPAASHPAPHQPLETSGTPDRTHLWLGWLAAILLLGLLR